MLICTQVQRFPEISRRLECYFEDQYIMVVILLIKSKALMLRSDMLIDFFFLKEDVVWMLMAND